MDILLVYMENMIQFKAPNFYKSLKTRNKLILVGISKFKSV
jgi:hypothetical protein